MTDEGLFDIFMRAHRIAWDESRSIGMDPFQANLAGRKAGIAAVREAIEKSDQEVRDKYLDDLIGAAQAIADKNRTDDGLDPEGSWAGDVYIPAGGGEMLTWYQIIDWLRGCKG